MRYAVLAWLSCQQYLAVAFLYSAVPAVLRQQGAPLEMLGLFGLVFFAFTVNFLWAPLLDRYRLSPLGRRRSWLLLMQLSAAAVLALAAGLDPARQAATLLALSLVLATLAATQRIATLGYAADSLAPEHRAQGAAVMGWGMSVGNAVGAAGGLYLIEQYGWTLTLSAAAILLAAGTGLLFWVPEPPPGGTRQPRDRAAATRPALWRAVGIIAPATFGVALAFPMAAPWLVDLGLPLTQVGLFIGAAIVLSFSTAGPLAGWWLRRLAPTRAIYASALLLTPLFVLAVLMLAWLPATVAAPAGVLLIFMALAVQNVAFNGFFYALARPAYAAGDVSFLAAMMSLIAMAGFATSGLVAAVWGYGATLAAAAVGYAMTAWLSHRQEAGHGR